MFKKKKVAEDQQEELTGIHPDLQFRPHITCKSTFGHEVVRSAWDVSRKSTAAINFRKARTLQPF